MNEPTDVTRSDQPSGQTSGLTSEQSRTSGAPWWAPATTQTLLRPTQVYKRTRRGIVGMVTFALLTVTGGWWVLTSTEVEYIEYGPAGEAGVRQSLNALVGGCGRMFTFPDADERSGTVPKYNPVGVLNRQYNDATIIPMFGRFWNDPIDPNQTFWDRDEPRVPLPEQLLLAQWQGKMVVYYQPYIPQRDLDTLQRLLQNEPELNMVVVPWSPEYGPMPMGRSFAWATWNRSQTCHKFAVPALRDFRRFYPPASAPGFDGTPPPPYPDATTD